MRLLDRHLDDDRARGCWPSIRRAARAAARRASAATAPRARRAPPTPRGSSTAPRDRRRRRGRRRLHGGRPRPPAAADPARASRRGHRVRPGAAASPARRTGRARRTVADRALAARPPPPPAWSLGVAGRPAAAPGRRAPQVGGGAARGPGRGRDRAPTPGALDDTLLSEVEAALDSRARGRAATPSTPSRPRALRDRGSRAVPSLIFRKGLDLKREVAGVLAENYHSELVAAIKANDYRYASGRLTVHLAREFGFCYGVDRAVDYAYQARLRFPDRRVFLTGEIIHNPHVNDQLRGAGHPLPDATPASRGTRSTADDVVILPAFGVTVDDAGRARRARLHAGRHHLRLGAERVEERQALRRRTASPRSSTARTGTRRRRPPPRRPCRCRAATTWSCSTATKPTLVCDYIRRHGGEPRRASSSASATRSRRASIPTCTSTASAAPTRRRCSGPSRSRIGEMFRAAMRRPLRRRRAGDALPGVRHHLQRHAGPAGRRRRAARRPAARPDDRDRRLQQQQHLQSGADLRRQRADLPHRRPDGLLSRRRDPASRRGAPRPRS